MATKIGFIGLGIMGKPMAINLVHAGYSLIVHDVNPEPVADLAASGATAADSPAAVATQADRIITMLPDGPEVEQVVLGEQGIIEAAGPYTILIDMSSISPAVSSRITDRLAQKGARCLDAPVSGGEPGAVAGTLAIMVGGPADVFEEMKPVFDVLGKSAVLVGDTGAGQTTKLVNQILVGIHIAAMGEAFVLAAKAGVNPRNVYEAIRGGLAGSHVLDAKVPLVLERNFTPGFRIELHHKDLKNAIEAASSMGLNLPITGQVQDLIEVLIQQGRGGDDHGGIVQAIEQANRIEIREDQV